MGIPVIFVCVLGIIEFISKGPFNPKYALILYPIFIVQYIAAIPFYFGLYQAYKILRLIDKGEAFSELTVLALKKIKYCAFTISGLYILVMPCYYFFAKLDDAPGILFINWIIIFTSIVIGFLGSVLQRLLKEAIEIKTENELTV